MKPSKQSLANAFHKADASVQTNHFLDRKIFPFVVIGEFPKIPTSAGVISERPFKIECANEDVAKITRDDSVIALTIAHYCISQKINADGFVSFFNHIQVGLSKGTETDPLKIAASIIESVDSNQ